MCAPLFQVMTLTLNSDKSNVCVKGLDLTNIVFSDPDRATAKGEGRDRATATVTGRGGGRDHGRGHLSG